MADSPWNLLCSNVPLKHYPSKLQNMTPILFYIEGNTNSRPKHYKFEVVWIRDSLARVLLLALAWANFGSPSLLSTY